MNLATIRANLQLNIANFNAGMRSARSAISRFNSDMARAATANRGMANEMTAGYRSLNQRLHTFGMGLRDIARITTGIVISQAFYTATRSIREATSAVWELNESLDYAQVTYSALFNSTSVATDFLNTLKEFSVDTIYEYSDLEGMARKLLAYGIEYKNLMYIIQGLTNIGTLSGDSAALERLAVALGQINAKGFLQAEEIRQLTNAYAPMYDILQSKFGLTREQLGNIGDLKLPAHEVINAIVDYANERFGDVATAAMYTITGLNNRIVDSLKVLGTDILKPFTNFYKSFAFYLGEQLEAMRAAFASGGLGGLFEHLIPNEASQQRIRTFLASIHNLATSIAALFYTLSPYIGQFVGAIVNGFSGVIAVLTGVIRGLTAVFQVIASNTPAITYLTRALLIAAAAWAMFRLHGLAAAAVAGVKAAIVGVANAVLFLARAILANPILTMILLIGGALIGFAASSNKANNAFSNLIDSFNSFTSGGAGATSDEILQTESALGGATTNSDQFWNSMEEGAGAAEDALDSANGAARKAAKGLLSFDEVFKLNQNAGGGGGGLSTPDFSGIGDALGGIGGGGGLLPDIPDFSEYTDKFVKTLFGDLWESVKTIASGAATGTIVGALVGFAIGGLVTRSMAGALAGAKLGAKIGSIAGAAFAGFWTTTYKQLEGSLLKIAASASAGTLIGGLVGMVIGAFATRTVDGALVGAKYGAAIGGLVGGGVGSFWAAATEEMSNAIEGIMVGLGAGALAGALIGLVIGAFSTRTLAGALAGAKLGAKIGAGLGAAFGGFFGSASAELQAAIKNATMELAMGALIGGLGGFVLGGFVTRTLAGALAGAKLGATIGAVMAGSISTAVDEAGEGLKTALGGLFSDVGTVGKGALIGALAGMLIGAAVGALAGGIGALAGAKVGATLGTAIGGLVASALDNSDIAGSIGAWFGSLATSIGDWFIGAWDWVSTAATNAWSTVSAWFSNLWTGISNWFAGLVSATGGWFSNVWDWVKNSWTSGWSSLSAWFSNLWTSISNWFAGLVNATGGWFSNVWDWVKNSWTSGWSALSTWFSNLWTSINEWFNGFSSDVGGWFANAWSWTKNAWKSGWSSLSTWFSNLWTSVSGWFTNLIPSVKSWFEAMWKPETWKAGWSAISTWFSNLHTSINSWFTNLVTNVKNWFDSLWNTDTWKSGWSAVSEWFSTLWNDIKDWFSSLGRQVNNWWNSLWSGKKANVQIGGGVTSSSGESYGGSGGSFNSNSNSSSVGGTLINTLFFGNGLSSVLNATKLGGYATGGIVSREQIARVAEGNKREAVIPLENETAMRPFSDAVSNNLLQTILPAVASSSAGSSNALPPMYVGTLIADERGIQQLYKKFQLIEAKELARKGLA